MHFCLFPEDVRTCVRTELVNLSCSKQGVGELAVLGRKRGVSDADVKGATDQDKVDNGALVVALTEELRAGLCLILNGVAVCIPLADPSSKNGRTCVRTA